MVKSFGKGLCLGLLCLFPLLALAWGAPAHRIIAQIAYDHLQPEAKQQVAYLNGLFDQNYHRQGRFDASAVWADQIVKHGITAFNSWHYINKPFSPDETPLPRIEKQNVVWAIHESYQVLRSDKATPFEKALFLRFLVHFVGDIHQPLHCITRVTKTHPQGDLGGNLYPIKVTHIENLHAYWDSVLGQYQSYYLQTAREKRSSIVVWAKDLMARYPRDLYQRQVADLNPETWADESYHLAIDAAYAVPERAAPTATYIAQGRVIAEQRIVLAGYRLAALLNQVFTRD